MKNKLHLLIIPSALLLYVVIALLCAIFFLPYIVAAVPILNTPFYMLFVFVFFALAVLASLAASICLTAFTVSGKANPIAVAKAVMIAKLVQIPAYTVIFVFCVFGIITVFFWGFVILLTLLDCFTLFVTALPNVAVIFNAAKQNKFSKIKAVLLCIVQFVFVVDIAASIWLYETLKGEDHAIHNSR